MFRLQSRPPCASEYEQGGEKSWETGEIVLRLFWEIWDLKKCRENKTFASVRIGSTREQDSSGETRKQ